MIQVLYRNTRHEANLGPTNLVLSFRVVRAYRDCNTASPSLYKMRHGDSLRIRRCHYRGDTRTRIRSSFLGRRRAKFSDDAYAPGIFNRGGTVDYRYRSGPFERREFYLGGDRVPRRHADNLHRYESISHVGR